MKIHNNSKNDNTQLVNTLAKNFRTRLIFIVLAIISIIIAFAKAPNSSKLNSIKSNITKTDKAITSTNTSIATLQQDNKTLLIKNKQKSANATKFNLTDAENKATDNINKGVKMALGGLKDSDDYKKHQDELTKLIGKNLTNVLYPLNGYHADYTLNDKQSFKFLLTKNTSVDTTFQNAENIRNAKIIAFVKYEMTDGNSDKVQETHSALITIAYDLLKDTVVDSDINVFN